MLEIKVENQTKQTICSPKGDLDAYTVGKFRTILSELEDKDRIVVNLSEVPFMDSAGLGALIGYMRRAREKKYSVSVVSSRLAITRLLHTTGFDRLVPIRETLEEAIAALDETSYEE